MRWVVGSSVLVTLALLVALLLIDNRDNARVTESEAQAIENALATGEDPPGDPWYQEHPWLTSAGAGVVIFVVGSIAVIAVNTSPKNDNRRG